MTEAAQGLPGLSTEQADEVRSRVGLNRIPDPPRPGVLGRVLAQLRDPMLVLLIVAAVLAGSLGDWSSTAIIALVVVFNTGAGVVQQVRAERAMSALRQLISPHAEVRRDGSWVSIDAELVVPGDLVALRAGDVLVADGTVCEERGLELNEASLTGESLPVHRVQAETVSAGTVVTRGRGTVLVTRIGADSSLGRIAVGLRSSPGRRTPLQRRLGRLSHTLVRVVLALTALVVVIGLLQGRSAAEMAVVGLSLAVAAVPESLPAVVTIGLALGAHRMARRNAVVRNLPAVETLGSVSVVATDKTGTLTEGVMRGEAVWTPSPPEDRATDRLLRDVVLCNDARRARTDEGWTVFGDPLDQALLALADEIDVEGIRERLPRVGEEAFQHETRRMLTRHDLGNRVLTVCKGAPEAVLDLLPAGRRPPEVTAARAAAEEFMAAGHRVIAVADDESGSLELVGLVAIGDPPRKSAFDVVTELQRAGVRLVLVTGDHPGTAETIARRVGIAGSDDRAVLGADLHESAAPDELKIVARVRPEQKVDVVSALQADGHVVAMLGDGVNDAPALRTADIGVAAGRSGTEVAKEAADVVLLDDDLATVVAAVQEGRRILANIGSFLVFALAGGFSEVGVMLLGPAVGLAIPLLPGQILWINLLTHGLTGVAFGGQPPDPAQMRRPPRPVGASVLDATGRRALVWGAVSLTVAALAASLVVSGEESRRTTVFLALGLGQLGVALALRVRRSAGGWRDRLLELAVGAAATTLAAAVWFPPLAELLETEPPSWSTLGVVLLAAAFPGLLVRLLGTVRHPGP
jgi:Ca2+-transporting ATPase